MYETFKVDIDLIISDIKLQRPLLDGLKIIELKSKHNYLLHKIGGEQGLFFRDSFIWGNTRGKTTPPVPRYHIKYELDKYL